jgi:phosphocarrier protein
MVKTDIEILNLLGIHARPASKLVKIASTGSSLVTLIKDGQRVNARSILGVMLLQAEKGSTVTIEVVGDDETAVLEKIVDLIHAKFGEE